MDDKIKGFSVLELVMVLAIAATLITIAGMWAVSFIADATLSQMRDQLLQNIEEARSQSISSVPYGIEFNSATAATNYALIRFPGGTCSSTGTPCATTLNSLGDGCNAAANEYCVFSQSGSFMVTGGITPTTMKTVAFTSGYIATLSFTGSPTGNYIWFDRKGMPHDNNWNTPSGVTTITVSKGGAANKSITIDTAGKVTYER